MAFKITDIHKIQNTTKKVVFSDQLHLASTHVYQLLARLPVWQSNVNPPNDFSVGQLEKEMHWHINISNIYIPELQWKSVLCVATALQKSN